MAAPVSDALVFFGATGDLAEKQIFPALQALVRHKHLDMPIIGVAWHDWTLGQFRAPARESLEKHGVVDEAVFAKLAALLQYVRGSDDDLDKSKRLRQALGNVQHPIHYLAIPPSLFEVVAANLAQSGCAEGACVVVEKPFGHDPV